MSINAMSNHDFYTLLNQVVRPAAPVSTFELLFGREKQLGAIESVLYSDGRSVFIYGDRGVGKTSLAHTIAYKLQEENEPIFVGCEPSSTLASIINDIVVKTKPCKNYKNERSISAGINLLGFKLDTTVKKTDERSQLNINSISSAVLALEDLTKIHSQKPFIVIDEFDQIESQHEKQNFGRLVKALGDQNINVKLIFTGISDSLHSLIGGHLSSERQIHQTHLEALPWNGRFKIIDNAFGAFELKVDDNIRHKIAGLSDGFPHYVHLLCEKILTCAHAKSENIEIIDHDIFWEGLNDAVDSISETLKHDYVLATLGRQEYFHHLLWAMADAEDLQREKKTIKHSYSEICNQKQLNALSESQFDRQFNKLKSPEFGEVIVNAFEGRKGWFKFKENMIRGYVRMLAENNGVSLDFQRRFTAREPTARHVGVKTSTYKPLTTVEERAYRIQRTKKKN
ncbi:ATP-binding protein [Edwardsiella ictaluri]|uniref:Archaeal ATPase n=2 Tax=Edwardsiella ictaluri TaxID=67780 RepID=C5B8B0_EDWI9|nr:ATP-binding protein [Edwardsiella ictaluri]ACR69480.1 Archaeal ATPase [Edwardsiella ictaluri 93-146]AVZ83499.1 ATP-binding protein [Edwardsiella ictaluri]EKS7764738.1 ATP-binding protein [Edwardsiella ictaluri]EKS7771610.1 ATP-binding protein [Edwardsiella ictaluri]EKS7774759.1 ATP-binding protein [Edwardsiella ictaluri]